jgi:hypothetical protein
MIFTAVSLVNGVTSVYAYELRKAIPGVLSKLTHICFGVAAILTANISLIYGFDKFKFRSWITPTVADILIIFTALLTVLVIINPLVTFCNKFRAVIKK